MHHLKAVVVPRAERVDAATGAAQAAEQHGEVVVGRVARRCGTGAGGADEPAVVRVVAIGGLRVAGAQVVAAVVVQPGDPVLRRGPDEEARRG
ncbi:hypothetical protein GCM10018963_65390 [Saccharothrix longispora]